MTTPLIEAVLGYLNSKSATVSESTTPAGKRQSLAKSAPPGHLQVLKDEGSEVIHIHDQKHPPDDSDPGKTFMKIADVVGKHLHAMYPKHYSSPDDGAKQYTDAHLDEVWHHEPVRGGEYDDPHRQYRHKHFKTLDEYAKREARASHRFVQDQKELGGGDY